MLCESVSLSECVTQWLSVTRVRPLAHQTDRAITKIHHLPTRDTFRSLHPPPRSATTRKISSHRSDPIVSARDAPAACACRCAAVCAAPRAPARRLSAPRARATAPQPTSLSARSVEPPSTIIPCSATVVPMESRRPQYTCRSCAPFTRIRHPGACRAIHIQHTWNQHSGHISSHIS